MGYLLGKNFRRRARDHLVPPRRMDAAVRRAEMCPFCRKHGRLRAAVQAPALGGIRCRLDQLDVVLWLVDLVEIGRARIRSAGKGHIYGASP